MAWVLLGALGAYIGEDLGLSASAKGLMVAVPLLSAAVFRVALGLLGDRYGPRRVGPDLDGASSSSRCSPAGSAPTRYGALLGVGVLLGVAGASFAIALPLASRHYPPRHQGLAMGIAGAGNSGTVLTTLAAPRLAEHFGWHAVFGLALIPVALVWVAFALLAKEPPAPAAPGPRRATCAASCASATPGACAASTPSRSATFVGLASFLPIFFHDQYGISKVDAATIVAVGAALGSLLRPLGGYLADRVGGTTVLTGVYGDRRGAAAVRLRAARARRRRGRVHRSRWATFGVGNGAVFQLVGLRYRERIGVLTGIVGAAGGLGGFFLPTILGTVARRVRLLRARASARSPSPRPSRWSRHARGRATGRARPERGHEDRSSSAAGSPARRCSRRSASATRDVALTLVCAEPRLPVRPRRALARCSPAGADPDTLTLRPASWYEDQRHRGAARHESRARPDGSTLDGGATTAPSLCTGSRRARAADPGRRARATSSAARRTARRSPAARARRARRR